MAGRPSRQRALDVWMNGQRVGRWSINVQGGHAFAYDAQWPASPHARPLSLSLPLGPRPLRGERVAAFFDNLLPTAALPRQRLQSWFGAASSHSFDLLAAAGSDCVGAVQLVGPGIEPGDPRRVDGEPLSERELVRLLDACAEVPGTTPTRRARLPHVVLAGARAKTALLRHGGHWCLPRGATPSTHILKLPLGAAAGGAPAISTSLENEWLCAELLRAFGFEVAASTIEAFGPHKVLLIERIDRRWLDEGWWARLPLEDLCQATATPPQRCAERDGGCGVRRMLDLLRASERAANDRERLLAALVAMWLLAVPDVSGRRLAIRLHSGGRFALAPLWGAISAWPVLGRTPSAASLKRLPWTLSPIGDPLTHHEITRQHWLQAARRHAVGAGFEGVLSGLAHWADRAIGSVVAHLPVGFPPSVSGPVFDGLRRGAQLLAR